MNPNEKVVKLEFGPERDEEDDETGAKDAEDPVDGEDRTGAKESKRKRKKNKSNGRVRDKEQHEKGGGKRRGKGKIKDPLKEQKYNSILNVTIADEKRRRKNNGRNRSSNQQQQQQLPQQPQHGRDCVVEFRGNETRSGRVGSSGLDLRNGRCTVIFRGSPGDVLILMLNSYRLR